MPRLKYIWGASEAIPGRWYAGLFHVYRRGTGPVPDTWVVSLRGLLCWLTPLAAIAWSLLAWAGYSFVRQNPHNLLSYSDLLLLPARISTVRSKLGQATIAEGMALARQGQWDDAASRLASGLARCPGDRQARLLLAEYALRNNQVQSARLTLADGFTGDYPGRAYLEAWFRVAMHAEDFDDIVGICARYLPDLERGGFIFEFQWLLDRQWAALSAAGRHADALVVLAELRPSGFREERRAATLLALRREDDAMAVVRQWRQLPGADPIAVARLEARINRQAGKLEEMEACLKEVRRHAADDPASWAFTLLQRVQAGRDSAAALALDEIIRRFGTDPAKLQLAIGALTEAGAAGLLERCVAVARERKFAEWVRWQRQLVAVHLGRAEWEQANLALEALPAEPAADAAERVWLEWARHLLGAIRSSAENLQLGLLDYCQEQALSVSRMSETAEALLRARRFETAQKLVERALEAFPANPRLTVLGREVRLHILANTPAVAPSPEDLAEQGRTMRGFQRQFESLVSAQLWAEAARFVAQTLQTEPEWMRRDDSAVRLAQVRLALARQDVPRAQAAARLLLNGGPERAGKAINVARELIKAGRLAEAEVLLHEVLRRHENHPAAQELLMAFKPAAASSTAPRP